MSVLYGIVLAYRRRKEKFCGRYHGTRHCDVNIEFLLDSLVLLIGRGTTSSLGDIWSRIDL